MKRILFLTLLISLLLGACITVAPTPTPTATPAGTVTSTPTITPTATVTPIPEPTAIPTLEQEGLLLDEEKLLELGYLPDFREKRELVLTTFTIPFNKEKRQGLGWRIGPVEIIFDEEYANLEADFGLGGHKSAGEVFIPNLDYPNGPEMITQAGYLAHALNLGVTSWREKNVPADWLEKYRDFLAQNSDASYPISGDVPIPDQPGAARLEKLGDVNPRLPIRLFILPPRLGKETWNQSDRILGGDKRAPFRLPYVDPYTGYFGVFVDENGGLNIYISEFTFENKLLDGKDYIPWGCIYTIFSTLAPHQRGTVSTLRLPSGIESWLDFFLDNMGVFVWSFR